jgi:hypothetical protein
MLNVCIDVDLTLIDEQGELLPEPEDHGSEIQQQAVQSLRQIREEL